MNRPLLLDLFCGAGGAAMGYHRAGFDIVGVDISAQPNYPFEFFRHDAVGLLDLLLAGAAGFEEWPFRALGDFDAIHASPPCQAYVGLASKDGRHPKLVEPVRAALRQIGVPYVIENVVGAPLLEPVTLCGSMFGLGVRRHRRFESNVLLMTPGRCAHREQGTIRAYYGKPGWLAWSSGAAVDNGGTRKLLLRGSVEQAPADMGIDWMTWDELREAIPPAYTEFIGSQLLAALPIAVAP